MAQRGRAANERQMAKKRRSVIDLSILGGEFMCKLFSIMFSAVLLLICSAQGTWAQKTKVYDLGHYPSGIWAELHGINELWSCSR